VLNPRSIRFRMTAWYVVVLTVCLALFGAAIYIGLAHYLLSAARESLRQELQAIGESLLFDYDKRGPSVILKEMTEDYAPEIKDRFIRVTLADGTELYRSGPPHDSSFDPETVAKPRQFEPGFRTEDTSRGRVLIESVWYRSPGGHLFFVENGLPASNINHILEQLLWCLGIAFPIVVAGAACGGYWIMRRSLRPVDEITKQAATITSHNLSERLPSIDTGDEIERLSTALNHMIARLEGAFHHINRFSADASHELRTPLTIIRGELESLVRDNHSPEETLEIVGSSLEEVLRLSKIVQDLLAISRLDAGETRLERVPVDLSALTASTLEQMNLLAEEKAIATRCEAELGVEIIADPWRLKQVIVNLIDNAIKYTGAGGQISVRVFREAETAILLVADNGIGIAPDDLPHIFERFYTTNRSRSREYGGTGLGLAIVKAICSAHDAEISVTSQPQTGTTFRVAFPHKSSLLHTVPSKLSETREKTEAGITA
jgi:heavy metal sensor kinase